MVFRMTWEGMTSLLLKRLLCLTNPGSGGVSRVAKGADCKSAALWLRRFESYLPHHQGKGIKFLGTDSGMKVECFRADGRRLTPVLLMRV
jgi:hypothetical protein